MPSGGYRKNAGRPEGTSKYKEKTVPIRIPITLIPYIKIALDDYARIGSKMTESNYDLFY
jgi:hypothetical protein